MTNGTAIHTARMAHKTYPCNSIFGIEMEIVVIGFRFKVGTTFQAQLC